MEAAAESIVGLEDEAARQLALDADVGLVTFGDAQIRIEPARECLYK